MEPFPQFKRLAPKIRASIWDAALPTDDPAALCLFTWRSSPEVLTPRGPFGRENEDTRQLIQVATPAICHVNREARSRMQRWKQKQGYETFVCPDRGQLIVREWDPKKDPIYVPEDRWADFLELVLDGKFGRFNYGNQNLRRVAISADLAYSRFSDLYQLMMSDLEHLRSVNILCDSPPQVKYVELPRYRSEDEDIDVCDHDIETGEAQVQPRRQIREVFDGKLSAPAFPTLSLPHPTLTQIPALMNALESMKIEASMKDDFYSAMGMEAEYMSNFLADLIAVKTA